MKEIQAIFVDCDGVLYDVDLLTYEEMVQACQQASTNLGLDWSNFAEVHQKLKDQGYRGIYNTVLGLCQEQDISFDSIAQEMAELLDYSSILPNPELLQTLQQVSQKKKLCIFTNNTRPHLEKVFKRLFQSSILDTGLQVITIESTLRDDHFHVKRMPGTFTYWCQELGILPKNTLMIDDTDNNITAAQEQGLQTHKIINTQMTMDVLKGLL